MFTSLQVDSNGIRQSWWEKDGVDAPNKGPKDVRRSSRSSGLHKISVATKPRGDVVPAFSLPLRQKRQGLRQAYGGSLYKSFAAKRNVQEFLRIFLFASSLHGLHSRYSRAKYFPETYEKFNRQPRARHWSTATAHCLRPARRSLAITPARQTLHRTAGRAFVGGDVRSGWCSFPPTPPSINGDDQAESIRDNIIYASRTPTYSGPASGRVRYLVQATAVSRIFAKEGEKR